MSRSLKKGPYIDEKLLKKIMRMNETNQRKVIKTWSRDSVIAPEFVGHTVAVHNGKQHIPVYVTEQMIGHHLGEFSPTRKFKGHGGQLAKATQSATAGGAGAAATPTAGASTGTAPAAAAPAAKPAGKSK